MRQKYSKQILERIRFELMYIHISAMEAYKTKPNETPDEAIERIKGSLDEICKCLENINNYINANNTL